MNTMLWICATLAVVIFGIMLHSVATFRSKPNSPMRRHALVEVAWTLVPILIVVAAAVPSLRIASDANVAAVAAVD
jgi:cytochrome c oxidase subunit II